MPDVGYLHDEVGYNYRLTNLAAALGARAAPTARRVRRRQAPDRGALRRGVGGPAADARAQRAAAPARRTGCTRSSRRTRRAATACWTISRDTASVHARCGGRFTSSRRSRTRAGSAGRSPTACSTVGSRCRAPPTSATRTRIGSSRRCGPTSRRDPHRRRTALPERVDRPARRRRCAAPRCHRHRR